uniref:Uncharacterized protein n=1 Tax=Cacopsylla melanoneura TaxID=428564 RepID=A0A8D8ZFC5_9HEMI
MPKMFRYMQTTSFPITSLVTVCLDSMTAMISLLSISNLIKNYDCFTYFRSVSDLISTTKHTSHGLHVILLTVVIFLIFHAVFCFDCFHLEFFSIRTCALLRLERKWWIFGERMRFLGGQWWIISF